MIAMADALILNSSNKIHPYTKPLAVDGADDEVLPEGIFYLPAPTRVFLVRRNLFNFFFDSRVADFGR